MKGEKGEEIPFPSACVALREGYFQLTRREKENATIEMGGGQWEKGQNPKGEGKKSKSFWGVCKPFKKKRG